MYFSKDLWKTIDDFKRMTNDWDEIDHKVKDETQGIILLNSQPDKYKEVKASIMYSRDHLTLDLVVTSHRAKDLEMKVNDKGSLSDSLIVKGISERDKMGLKINQRIDESLEIEKI